MKEIIQGYINKFPIGTMFYLSKADSNAAFKKIDRATELVNVYSIEPGLTLDDKLKSYHSELGFEVKNKHEDGGRIYLVPADDF